MEQEGFVRLLVEWIIGSVSNINNQPDLNISQYLPEEYRPFWPSSRAEAQLYAPSIHDQL